MIGYFIKGRHVKTIYRREFKMNILKLPRL